MPLRPLSRTRAQEVSKNIYKRLFRVYAHIYHSHFKQVCSLDEEAHLNTCFKHFIFFTMVRCGLQRRWRLLLGPMNARKPLPCPSAPGAAPCVPASFACLPLHSTARLPPAPQHYNLVDAKELAPLQELIDQFQGKAPAAPS